MLFIPALAAAADFSIDSIMSPPDTVRAGSGYVPSVIVQADEGNPDPEAVLVQLRIGTSYADTASIVLVPGEKRPLEFFPPWQPDSPGPVVARCSLLTPDDNQSNDTLSKGITVLAPYRDFSILAMATPAIMRLGESVALTAVIHADEDNPGPESVAARLIIGSSYCDTVKKKLDPGQSFQYTFKLWHADSLAVFPVSCSLLVADSVPDNDTLSRSITVLDQLVDFAAEAMSTLPPIVHVSDLTTPVVTVHALEGNPQPESVTVRVWIGASFTDTARKLVPPGVHVAYQFKPWQAESVGTFPYRCSLYVQDSFPSNDTNRISLAVYPQGSDFDVVNITSPPDSVTLDSQVVPTALVHSAIYSQTESVSVRMRVGTSYEHTKDTVIPAGGAINVTFPTWQAQPLGSTTARCTLLTTDNDSTNNSAGKQVRVDNPLGGQPLVEWTSLLSHSVEGRCIQQTLDGGYVVTGNGSQSVFLAKLDSAGSLVWDRDVAAPYRGEGNWVCQTIDRGFIVAGWVETDTGERAYLAKTDPAGNLLWQKVFFREFGVAYSVQQTRDRGYMVVGTDDAEDEIHLVKLDSTGAEAWRTAYSGESSYVARSVVQTDDCGYALGGWVRVGGTEQSEECRLFLAKTDSLGNHLWQRVLGPTGDNRAYSMQPTRDKGFVLAGMMYTHDQWQEDFYLAKTDSLGSLVWAKPDNQRGDQIAYSASETWDHGYVIVGMTDDTLRGARNILVLRTDSLGYTTRTTTLGDRFLDGAYSVQQTRDSGFVVAGYMYTATPYRSWLSVTKFGPE